MEFQFLLNEILKQIDTLKVCQDIKDFKQSAAEIKRRLI